MNWKTIKTLLATILLAGLFGTWGAGSAHALLIDHFLDDQAASDNTTGDGAESSFGGPINLSAAATDLTNATREIFVECTGGCSGGLASVDGFVEQASTGDVYSHAQDTGTTGTSELVYAFNAADFGSAGDSISIELVVSDLGGEELTLTIEDADGTTAAVTLSPGAAPDTLVYTFAALSAAAVGGGTLGLDLTAITDLSIFIDGGSVASLDLSIDLLGVIPEPASLALFGIGLLGFGYFYRRRRRRLFF